MKIHPGFGVGLRSEHFRHVLEQQPDVDWFEIISENFLDNRGWPRHVLDRVAERHPVVMHGVSLSIGSTDPIGFDPVRYIESIPPERVVQMHVAGHTHCGTHIIDTHDGQVIDRVWELYALAYRRTNGVATLVEWDSRIPPFEVLHAEALKAKEWASGTAAAAAAEESFSSDLVHVGAHPLSLAMPEEA